MKQNIFYELIICLLIWGLLSSNTAFAVQDSIDLKKDYLSPRINLSKKSLKKVISIFSKMQIDAALEATAANINEIGRINFKRELSSEELLVAWAMIFEGRSLRDIDNHFRIRKNPKQKTVEALSGFIGWSLGFFYWREKKIDSKNKHIFVDPIEDLNKKQKKQFRDDIKQVMRSIINEWEENPPNYNPARTEDLFLTINQLTFEDRGLSVLEINFPGLLLSSI